MRSGQFGVTPHPDPPPQGGREKEIRTPHPDPPPQGGREKEIKTPHPDPPLQGGGRKSGDFCTAHRWWSIVARSLAQTRLRVGIVGCGLIAQVMHLHHLRELQDRFRVVALCDLSRTVVDRVGEAYGVDRRFTDWTQLLEEPLDAVMVLTSGSHEPIAVAAAQAGRHDPAVERMAEELSRVKALRFASSTTSEYPLKWYVAHYPIIRGNDVDARTVSALEADDEARVTAAIGIDDPVLR